MFKIIVTYLAVSILVCTVSSIFGKQVTELQSLNFELAITSYRYLSVLFYDSTEKGIQLEALWNEAASKIDKLCDDCEIAKIDASDPELKEIIDAYMLSVPCIRIFRRGIMGEYRGPLEGSNLIAAYIKEDSLPSVEIVKSLAEIKAKIKENSSKSSVKTVVLGFFNMTEDEFLGKDDSVAAEGYSIDPWGQFQASADALRGHAIFYGILPDDALLGSFKIKHSELPVLYLVAEGGDSLTPYHGEILEAGVTEWVLRHSAPSMDELSFTRPSGELYATQFFSAKKLKFILFFPGNVPVSNHAAVLAYWKELSETFRTQALFAYMVGNAVPDVLEYFSIDEHRDLPIIIAHEPAKDHKFISRSQIELSRDEITEFVAGVISGKAQRIMKSEPIPRPRKKTSSSSHVVKLVGKTVVDAVSRADTDVLLEIYTPYCAQCKRLMPTIDILAKAVASESRILIAKIDGYANDLPPSWNVKSYPALLWFPSRDKPYNSDKGPVPRPYWDAGHSLVELISFVQRHGSFDSKSLKIATNEQISSLLSDEEVLRKKYELEEVNERRNEGRDYYSNEIADYILGEIVFDGKRWHIGLLAVLIIFVLGLLTYIVLSSSGSKKLKKKSA